MYAKQFTLDHNYEALIITNPYNPASPTPQLYIVVILPRPL